MIMVALVALLGVALLTGGYIALTNRTMFRMGLRNLPRRGFQTVLVVAGLSLSTLITTAAFVTGDTIDHSLTADVYKIHGRQDIDITWNGERKFDLNAGVETQSNHLLIDGDLALTALEAAFADDAEISAFLPYLTRQAPVTNLRNGVALPAIELTGVDGPRLDTVGGLTLTDGQPAAISALRPGETYLSELAASRLEARRGDPLMVHANGSTQTFRVAGIVRDEIASGVFGLTYSSVPGGMALPIDAVRALVGLDDGEISSLTVALAGESRSTVEAGRAAAQRLAAFVAVSGPDVFAASAGGAGPNVEVFASKADAIEEGEKAGNTFTTFFLVLGLFSMAAGVMLIFMIFVMLAAERRAEIGMARAVGAQRGHIVQSFVAEGMANSLLAGLIGVAAGVLASFAMTEGLLKAVGGDYFSLIETKITWTSLVIGYSLGVVITFVTVVFASLKVSQVNIVAAIRLLPDEVRRERKRQTSWLWVAAGVPALLIPPLGLWMILRKGAGLPTSLILGPCGLLMGALFIIVGHSGGVLFFFALGISLLPLSLASIARYYGAPSRPLWTLTGFALAAYWLLPPSMHDSLFGAFETRIEMFVLSGVMVVASFTLVIVFNARLLTGLFTGASTGRAGYLVTAAALAVAATLAAFGMVAGDDASGAGQVAYLVAAMLLPVAALAAAAARFPHLAPALKMAVAYPLANRFRTGMTVAMFSIIVFSLTVFSVLLANFDTAFLGGDARGNLDVVATSTTPAAAADVRQSLAASGAPVVDDIAAVGRVTLAGANQAVLHPGSNQTRAGNYPVLAADDEFLGALRPELDSFARDFASQEDVLEAVRTRPDLALVDASVAGALDNYSYDWPGGSVTVEDDRFDAFELVVVDTATGTSRTVTVVGTLKVGLDASIVAGVYLSEPTYARVFGAPAYQRLYIRLIDGTNPGVAARDIQSALALAGLEADSIERLIDDEKAQDITFNRMFQAFMALGLLVGIAGLGVISFRSVVERRQQIGMLRAIGYQRRTVTTTFLLEASFIAIMGILSGVVGGTLIARNLLTSESFTAGAPTEFAMPWIELGLVAVIAFAFSLLTTWWPSRRASRVPVAEALRYD